VTLRPQDDPRSIPRTILVVDDEETVLRVVGVMLRKQGFEVRACSTAQEALSILADRGVPADVVLTDLHMPGLSGMDLLRVCRQRWPELPVIMMTGRATVPAAIESMKLGAYDFLVKPFDPIDTLVSTVRRAVDYKSLVERNTFLERQAALAGRFEQIVGTSAPMRRLYTLIESVAPTDATVLLMGESGTGKELVASAIHKHSRRKRRHFVAVNCAALTESVIDSELFGHAAGAFTGATSNRRGLFEEATEGTLFLDEIGEVPPATQIKLLRAVQEGEVRPVGTNQPVTVDVRLIAATNRDLRQEVQEGRFRQDLYYRLNVVSITLPPLREREGDIPALTHHFVQKYAARLDRSVTGISPEAMDRLVGYPWPGNVRELENAIEHAVILTRGEIITDGALPAQLLDPPSSRAVRSYAARPLKEVEREHIIKTLEVTGWQVEGRTGAAAVLGLKPATLRSRMQKLGIRRPPI
jgi:DNA-binding NtrC family response regulator